jgi:arylsulfatase A
MRLLVLATLLSLASPALADDSAAKPNIVFILADDLGWGDLACYGHKAIKTPNLDALAKRGMRFTHAYSAGSVCSPSRSAILTGRTPYRNGVFTWIPEGTEFHLKTSEISLPTLLKRLGYLTCHVGKWHLNGIFNSPKQPQPNDHGYDWWLATQNNAAPSHKNPNNFARNGKAVGKMEGYSADLVAAEAVDWLKNRRDKAKPFLLSVWFHEPHLPIESDPELQALYPEQAKIDPNLAQHHANVTQMDRAVGRVLQTLKDLKLDENTIIVFTSDNGPEGDGSKGRTRGSTGGLRGRKRSLYQGGIRVPAIMVWPGKTKPGSESDEPVVGSDWFVTLGNAAGAELPKDRPLDGADISPIFAGKSIGRKTPMYWRYHGAPGPMKMSIREGDWYLLSDLEHKNFELYNLRTDPKETNNLYEKEPQRSETMRRRLIELNREIEKEGPQWWKGYKKG